MWIDGAWVTPGAAARATSSNPATQEVLARVAEADAGDVCGAVDAARRAFDADTWPELTNRDRGQILFRKCRIPFKWSRRARQVLPSCRWGARLI